MRPTPHSRDNDAAFTAYQTRLSRRAEAAAEFVLALVLAIAGAVLALHWLAPCEAGHLCVAAVALRRVRAGSRADEQPSALPIVGEAVRLAYQHGIDAGERTGYVEGWRWGAICGFLLGILSGGCLVAGALMMGVQS